MSEPEGKEPIGVVGSGAWGTALANHLAHQGYPVALWAYELEVVASIRERRENALYLPGIKLSSGIAPTVSLEEAVGGKRLVLSVSPSHVVRKVMAQAAPHLRKDAVIVSASKGLETDTLKRMSEVLGEVLPPALHSRIAVLSGPSFAKEVARGLPTAVTLAARRPALARLAQKTLSGGTFRVYTAGDVVGTELGGSLKNVIALAAGVSDGLGLGLNARAALITRGLSEMARLGKKMGAKPLTFAGLSGMGDLVLTATGDLSRNRRVGIAVGEGKSLKEILSGMREVAEGVNTARAARALSLRHKVEMPIATEVYLLLEEGKSPRRAMEDLLRRELKAEHL